MNERQPIWQEDEDCSGNSAAVIDVTLLLNASEKMSEG